MKSNIVLKENDLIRVNFVNKNGYRQSINLYGANEEHKLGTVSLCNANVLVKGLDYYITPSKYLKNLNKLDSDIKKHIIIELVLLGLILSSVVLSVLFF